MSSENEDQCFTVSPVVSKSHPNKQTKISYTRDFLLSFSHLDICKKLPAGFDASILSEFEDTSNNIPEWQKVPGGLSLQNLKRSEYGTSPPNNYSRGSQGRWDTRSSGSNDRDGDFQSDRESDTGRRYGNQSRKSWQNPEHDGLLGSGAFPRPSGSGTGGSIASKIRGNDQYPLNRSSEPYQPPRPYKALPHMRRDNTDMFNDETFGPSECSSEDRAEEERNRRASFELMRKEQQKTLQEKQKTGIDKHKDQVGTDICILLGSSEAEKTSWNCNSNKSEDCPTEPIFENESVKCSLPTQAPAARPLIPPGFKSSVLEKNIGAKLLAPSPAPEVGHSGVEDDISRTKFIWMAKGSCDNQDDVKSSTRYEDTSEKNVLPSLDVEVSDYSIPLENPKANEISIQREAGAVWPDGAITDFEGKKLAMGESLVTPGEGTSILQKLFDSALTLNGVGSLSSAEHPAVKLDVDRWNPVPSSKFAHWFLDEEPKISEDHSSFKSRDLLSLISDKGGHHISKASDETAVERLPSSVLFEKGQVSQTLVEPHKNVTSEANLTVLTCEDLEQVILAEASESSMPNLVQGGSWDVLDSELEPPKDVVDNNASQHLLSLLQKGFPLKESAPGPSFDVGTTNNNGANLENVEEIHSAEKTLTLETLFGSAFMKELQSVGAPVSVQRGTTAMAATLGDCGPDKINPQSNLMALNHTDANSDVFQEDWLGPDNPRTDNSNLSGVGFEERVDGAMELLLPEEESLISMGGDAVQLVTSKTQDFLSSKAPVEIVDKLTTLNAIIKGERSMLPGEDGGTVFHDAYDLVNPELPFQHSHGQPSSSPPFSRHQMSHHNMRPFFQQHTHRNPQMIGAENILHHDFSHFPSNAFHHPHFNGSGGPRFDPPHHPIMPQMRSLHGKFPPSQMLQGLPRGLPLSPPINHMGGYITPDLGPLQAFALNHRQPNFPGTGMMVPGQINNPESVERLEMELRAKQQILPTGAGQAAGMYVRPELDMGFRYR